MRRGVAALVVVVLLAALAVVADRITARAIAAIVRSELAAAGFELGEQASVRVAGFPVLTQLLSGRLDEVTISAASAEVEGMTLTDLSGYARGVEIASPFVAESADFAATVPAAELGGALGPFPAQVEVSADAVVVSASILAVPVVAVMEPTAEDPPGLELQRVSVAGVEAAAESIPALLRGALADLADPSRYFAGVLELTELTLLPGEGIRVRATGSDVPLETLSAAG